jgi:hypothetical protein
MVLLGFGASFAFLTVILASVSGVPEDQAGLASGLVNTSQQMGGALGLAVLASVAAFRTEGLLEAGSAPVAALNAGLHAAFLLSAILLALGAVLGATLLRLPKTGARADSDGPEGVSAKERETGGETDAWARKG